MSGSETMHSAVLDFSCVLSECEEINSILYKPINSTQRIKYTCFNVSSNYIILGSTSGSIYLFSREPCSFLQIIPLSEGTVTHIAISPDEKSVAVSTIRGIVCLVSLKPTPKLLVISIEHICEQITCLCWNDNSTEIYIGDIVGRVSVMVLSAFPVNSIFQAPTYILMNLDSSIVQLNFSSPLLLVSTLARCYICDVVHAQYKQIGKKTRNGEFGACFYKAQPEEGGDTLNDHKEEKNINSRDAFNLVTDSDSDSVDDNLPKIFCARPGSRLWEVSANGVVVKTHQLKEALAIPPLAIFRPASGSSHEEETEREWPPQSLNFSHLFIIAQKYLFSYTTSGLYIIDLVSATVVLWSNEFTNISMTNIVDNRIYLMTCDNKFHCLTLLPLDTLILRLYQCKKYYDCLNVCIAYKSQLLKMTDNEKIIELFGLQNLPHSLQDEEMVTRLHPLMSFLESISGSNQPIKLNSGIVVVHSGNKLPNETMYQVTSRALEPSDTSGKYSSQVLESTKDSEGNIAEDVTSRNITETSLTEITDLHKNETLSVENNIEQEIENYQECNPEEHITHKVQADLEPVYMLVNSIRPTMSTKEIEKIILDIDKNIRTIKEFYKDSSELQDFIYEVTRVAELHYYDTFLENISTQLLHFMDNDQIVRQSVRAFIDINAQNYMRCSCGYPYPMNKVVQPKFLTVGETLIKNLADNLPEECTNICDKVPYMWRKYMPICVAQHDLDNLLRQCLQTRDNIVLSFLLAALNEQQWNSVKVCLKEIEEGTCLFCAVPLVKKSDYNMLIDWSGIAKEIMTREGPDEATVFLIKLENVMPNVSFDKSIFQSIVFTKMLHHRGIKRSIDLNKSNQLSSEFATMCSLQLRDQLAKTLEKDLGRPIDNSIFGAGAHHWGVRYQAKSLTCSCCTLSLQTPVLLGNNGIAIFRCGHAYHVNCMIERKLTKCNLHQ